LDPVTDIGGGLVRLHNGKVYRLEAGQIFHTPQAAGAMLRDKQEQGTQDKAGGGAAPQQKKISAEKKKLS